ncbi:MAG: hydroxypyruvate isomerase family protein [Burkholderiaceae bacterium]|jgi:hydroxypyruvate isomerase|nr:hydroxypyruvate isomerase family protein [Burkholderiaceae bacterium]
MPRFAANLSMLYGEWDFLDRFEAAARDGFEAVECLFPYAWPAAEIAARLAGNGLRQVLLNASPGNWNSGERGLAALPGREAQFRAAIAQALRYAQTLACPRIHVMAGRVPESVAPESVLPTYLSNLRWAAAEAAREGVELLIEPINTRDMPGYLLTRQAQAHAILEEAGAPNLKVQMDLYHCQIMEGDVTTQLRQYLPTGRVGHLQIAGVPQRHEPDAGELNFPYLFSVIDQIAAAGHWAGWIGCEYRPAHGTRQGLGWLRAARSVCPAPPGVGEAVKAG